MCMGPPGRKQWAGLGVGVTASQPLSSLQKMFQCPYFFFDVVYIHNGTEEKEEQLSWQVRAACLESASTW